MNKRGVKIIYTDTDTDIVSETVCYCECHDSPGMMHVVACCNPPKTKYGIDALIKSLNNSKKD